MRVVAERPLGALCWGLRTGGLFHHHRRGLVWLVLPCLGPPTASQPGPRNRHSWGRGPGAQSPVCVFHGPGLLAAVNQPDQARPSQAEAASQIAENSENQQTYKKTITYTIIYTKIVKNKHSAANFLVLRHWSTKLTKKATPGLPKEQMMQRISWFCDTRAHNLY